MADINEYTIHGDDLEMLLADIDEGGGLGTGAYKITVRVYPTAQRVAFRVNDGDLGMPMGELTHTIHA